MTTRQRVFINHQGTFEWLATGTGDVVTYKMRTLVNLDPRPKKHHNCQPVNTNTHTHTHIQTHIHTHTHTPTYTHTHALLLIFLNEKHFDHFGYYLDFSAFE